MVGGRGEGGVKEVIGTGGCRVEGGRGRGIKNPVLK
jgi:hypothetical protein